MISQRFSDAGEAVKHLKRRVAERRKQEPREKFVKDHQLIHDRKKNDVYVPILPGHDQETWFAKLDSNEIWERVFEYVTNPSDVTSAYFACEMFRKHLEEKRKMMMLPKVLGVFRDKGRLQYSGFQNESYFSADRQKDESREILKLRLVSKAWKKAIEDAFLVPLMYSDQDWGWKHTEMSMYDPDDPLVCKLRNVEDVKKALEALGSTTSGASLIRTLWMDDEYCEDKESFYSKLVEFLDIHGGAVWGLKFCTVGLQGLTYDGLREVVSKMPHLKILYLDDSGGSSKIVRAGLQQVVVQNPFPIMTSLELCVYSNYCSKYDPLVAETLRKGVNLKAVCIEFDYWVRNHVIPTTIWDQLENLSLEYFRLCYEKAGDDIFCRDFLRLSLFDWPLKDLHVTCTGNNNYFDFGHNFDANFNASIFFTVLNRFNDHLVKVKVSTGSMIARKDQRSVVAVDFPSLKEIDLPRIFNYNM